MKRWASNSTPEHLVHSTAGAAPSCRHAFQTPRRPMDALLATAGSGSSAASIARSLLNARARFNRASTRWIGRRWPLHAVLAVNLKATSTDLETTPIALALSRRWVSVSKAVVDSLTVWRQPECAHATSCPARRPAIVCPAKACRVQQIPYLAM